MNIDNSTYMELQCNAVKISTSLPDFTDEEKIWKTGIGPCPIIGLSEEHRSRLRNQHNDVILLLYKKTKLPADIIGHIFSFFCKTYDVRSKKYGGNRQPPIFGFGPVPMRSLCPRTKSRQPDFVKYPQKNKALWIVMKKKTLEAQLDVKEIINDGIGPLEPLVFNFTIRNSRIDKKMEKIAINALEIHKLEYDARLSLAERWVYYYLIFECHYLSIFRKKMLVHLTSKNAALPIAEQHADKMSTKKYIALLSNNDDNIPDVQTLCVLAHRMKYERLLYKWYEVTSVNNNKQLKKLYREKHNLWGALAVLVKKEEEEAQLKSKAIQIKTEATAWHKKCKDLVYFNSLPHK